MDDVEYLGLDDLLVIASTVLRIEAGVLAKMANLVVADVAVNAPAASFGGVEFYPEFTTKVGGARLPIGTPPCTTGREQADRFSRDGGVRRAERAHLDGR